MKAEIEKAVTKIVEQDELPDFSQLDFGAGPLPADLPPERMELIAAIKDLAFELGKTAQEPFTRVRELFNEVAQTVLERESYARFLRSGGDYLESLNQFLDVLIQSFNEVAEQ